MNENKNLREYLAPLVDMYKTGYLLKKLGITYTTLYRWYEKGFPKEEYWDTDRITNIVVLAKMHEKTRHINERELKKYINNPKGE